ncbi:MAG TPA: hypothetical protein VL096_15590 [Pirellulaceae bacterium]|nr:hypothetical protein [Pirellulaceae bacterium]
MAKNQNRKKRIAKAQQAANAATPTTSDDRRGEVATVGWMLAMLATTAADFFGVLAMLIVPAVTANATNPGLAPLLPRLLLFIAAITGTVCVLVTPVVYRFRRIPPPLPITVFGLVVSVLPVLVLFWWSLESRS